ncbi:MAG: hypothetical protein ACFCU9_06275 [Cyanophyceae cyanobacterium]
MKQRVLLDLPQGAGASLAFTLHETFYPRYDWLKKGFEAGKEGSPDFSVGGCPGAAWAMVRSIST